MDRYIDARALARPAMKGTRDSFEFRNRSAECGATHPAAETAADGARIIRQSAEEFTEIIHDGRIIHRASI